MHGPSGQKAHPEVLRLIYSFASFLQFPPLSSYWGPLRGHVKWVSWEVDMLNLIPLFTWESITGRFCPKSFSVFSLLLCKMQKQSDFLTPGASRFLDSPLPFISAVKPNSSWLGRFLSCKFSINTASDIVILRLCFPSLFPCGSRL